MTDPNITKAAIEAGKHLADYVGDLAKNPLVDLIGFMVGDRLRHKRIRNLARLEAETRRLLLERNIQEPYCEPNTAIAISILGNAADESRAEIQNLWAQLLASAMDERTKHKARRSFIAIISEMEPVDAKLFEEIFVFEKTTSDPSRNLREKVGREYYASVECLARLGLIRIVSSDDGDYPEPTGTAYALRECLRGD